MSVKQIVERLLGRLVELDDLVPDSVLQILEDWQSEVTAAFESSEATEEELCRHAGAYEDEFQVIKNKLCVLRTQPQAVTERLSPPTLSNVLEGRTGQAPTVEPWDKLTQEQQHHLSRAILQQVLQRQPNPSRPRQPQHRHQRQHSSSSQHRPATSVPLALAPGPLRPGPVHATPPPPPPPPPHPVWCSFVTSDSLQQALQYVVTASREKRIADEDIRRCSQVIAGAISGLGWFTPSVEAALVRILTDAQAAIRRQRTTASAVTMLTQCVDQIRREVGNFAAFSAGGSSSTLRSLGSSSHTSRAFHRLSHRQRVIYGRTFSSSAY